MISPCFFRRGADTTVSAFPAGPNHKQRSSFITTHIRVAPTVLALALVIACNSAGAAPKPKPDPYAPKIQMLADPTAGIGVDDPVCPDIWGDSQNVVDAVSTHVSHAVNMHAKVDKLIRDKDDNPITTKLTVSIDHPHIASVSLNNSTGYSSEITVTIPAGSLRSETFYVRGNSIGQTTLSQQRHPTEADPTTYLPTLTPVNVWNFEKIVDYNDLGGSNICYDLQSSPNLHPDALQRTACGSEVKKVAADGESRLLFRIKSGLTGQACFKPVPKPMNLVDLGSFDAPNPEQVPTDPALENPYWTYGTYLPPQSFDDTSATEREVEIEIGFMPTGLGRTNITLMRKKITIKRPPVLLVHGLWSSTRETWGGGFTKPNPAGGWLLNAINYTTNSSSFVASTGAVAAQITQTLADNRTENDTASTQVDIIAHSMGGLITRTVLAGPDFANATNFHRGDVRRVVTITTPHLGTQIANMLINLHQSFPHGGAQDPVRNLERKLGTFHKGAVCNLAENSDALEFGPAYSVRSYAITASGGVTDALDFPLSLVAWWEFSHAERQAHINPYVFRVTQPNDGIVAVDSQNIGGAVLSRDYPSLEHSSKIGDGVTKDVSVAQRVYQLLDSNSDGAFTNGLPSVTNAKDGSVSSPGVGRGDADKVNYVNQCLAGKPMMQ